MNNKKAGIVLIICALLFISSPEINSADNYEEQGLPVPGVYPEVLVPLLEGYKIVCCAFNNKGDYQEVRIKYMVDVDFDKVIDFYKEILSRGHLSNEEKLLDDLYLLAGELEDKTIEIKAGAIEIYDNFKSYVLISIKGNFGKKDFEITGEINGKDVNIDLSSANINITDVERIPAEYPVDLIPIYGGSRVIYGEKDERDKTKLILQFYSREDKVQVLNFYKRVLKNAENKEDIVLEMKRGILYSLSGVLNDYKASFVISDVNIEDFNCAVLIYLKVGILE